MLLSVDKIFKNTEVKTTFHHFVFTGKKKKNFHQDKSIFQDPNLELQTHIGFDSLN